jgi:exopolysaccharide production protein ExoQ
LGAVWRVLTLLRSRGQPNRGRHLLAQGILLALGVGLLVVAHSATSGACFVLGTGLMLAACLPMIRRRPAALHALIGVILIGGGLALLLGGNETMVHAVGRQSDLTGRTAIWEAVIPLAPNAAVGAGFENFWLGPRLEKMWRDFPVLHLNEAHDGYIEVYLNLGWVGVGLIVLILVGGYKHATAMLRRNPLVGALMLAYVAAAATYSVTEVGFRLLNPMWIFLLLAVSSGGYNWGVGTKASRQYASKPTTRDHQVIEENHAIAGPGFSLDRVPTCAPHASLQNHEATVGYPELIHFVWSDDAGA